MSESALKIDHMQRHVYRYARLNTNTMFLIIVSFSLGPVYEFVCISFRTDNLNCFMAS